MNITALTRSRKRARARGVSTVSTVLESAMVMGWFVALILGEKQVSNATDARRKAETASEESATAGSANYCTPSSPSTNGAQTSPSVEQSGKPNVSSAVSLVQGLGLGSERTFANYTTPMKNVVVSSTSTANPVEGKPADDKQFQGQRQLGCLEKPLDVPKGTLDSYRQKLWNQNLQGY